jgi:hypothetical protein
VVVDVPPEGVVEVVVAAPGWATTAELISEIAAWYIAVGSGA